MTQDTDWTAELSPKTRELLGAIEAALPSQKTDEFEVYAEGLLFSSACTSLSDEEALARRNLMPSGTSHGWFISHEPAFKGGQPNPCPCEQKPDTHRHILFEC